MKKYLISLVVVLTMSFSLSAGEWKTISGATCDGRGYADNVSSGIDKSNDGAIVNVSGDYNNPRYVLCTLPLDYYKNNVSVYVRYYKGYNGTTSTVKCAVTATNVNGQTFRYLALEAPTTGPEVAWLSGNMDKANGGSVVLGCSLPFGASIQSIAYRSYN